MNLAPEDRQHITNIVDAIVEIEGYIQFEDYNTFTKDEFAKEAVARLMQDIGGAAKMVSEEFKALYSDVDWDVLIRLQDAMYDQAEETSYEAIWGVIKEDLPVIKDQMADLAANIREEDDIHGFDLTPDDPNTK